MYPQGMREVVVHGDLEVVIVMMAQPGGHEMVLGMVDGVTLGGTEREGMIGDLIVGPEMIGI